MNFGSLSVPISVLITTHCTHYGPIIKADTANSKKTTPPTRVTKKRRKFKNFKNWLKIIPFQCQLIFKKLKTFSYFHTVTEARVWEVCENEKL